MKPNLLCIFLILYFPICLYAVDNLRIADIRSLGMKGNEVVHSALFNPALIALKSNSSIQFNYFNRYSLKELKMLNGSFYFPNSILSAGLDISSFGYDAYRESLFRLSLSKQLTDRWTLGIGLQYVLLQTELFDEKPAQLSTDIGIIYFPVDNLLIGMLIMNLPSVNVGDKLPEISNLTPYLIQTGFQWEIINNLFISSTLSYGDAYKIAYSGGIEYIPFEDFSIRAGVGGKPFMPSLGIGYNFFQFTIDVATTYHSVLGMSTGMGIKFKF